jgi:hypothetical protein
VRAELDASLPDGAAQVVLELRSGERLEEIVMNARGSLADPLSDADIESKLRACVTLGGSDWDADGIIDAVWRLDTLKDVSSLISAPRRPGGG